MTMTADEQTGEGQHSIPMEGEDITPKKDGGVLKVNVFVFFNPASLAPLVSTHPARLASLAG